MNNEQAIDIAKEYFPSYPKVSEFFVTTDEQVFEQKHMAENHVKSFTHKENFFVFSVKKSGDDYTAEMTTTPFVPLTIGVPANSIVHSEKPETVVVTGDKDANKQLTEGNKDAADQSVNKIVAANASNKQKDADEGTGADNTGTTNM